MSDFKQEVVEKLLHNTFNEANVPSDWHKPEEQANLAIGVILSRQEKKPDFAYRLESDSIGEKKVAKNAYYGVQTLRGAINFPITGMRMHRYLIDSVAEIKKAAAITNYTAGRLDEERATAISQACDEIVAGYLHDQFIVDPIQGGAGTSLNMNANEVIANRAIEILGGEKGDYSIVHPNDHVNFAQSTNDVFPSCGKMTAIKLILEAQKALNDLASALQAKAKEFDNVLKMGRTQLQDAVPIRLGQEFSAYAAAVQRDIKRFDKAVSCLADLPMGGTAIGTGLNADINYVNNIVPNIVAISHLPLRQAENLVDATQNLDGYVEASGIIKTCAVNLSKMCNDLRLLSSGPRCGFAEINLPSMQNGSSIMPGKVNPVIPEVVNQVAFNIIGNDTTITLACEAGQMELNAFEPVIFYNLFQSAETLTHAVRTLIDNCINGISVNEERCRDLVNHSIGIVTALNPYIGYKNAAKIAKEAQKTGRQVGELILENKLLSSKQLETLMNPQNMTGPGISGDTSEWQKHYHLKNKH